MAKVSIQLGKSIDVAHTDNIIEIGGIGRLIFSKGSVEWQSSPKWVNQKKYTWPAFAKLLADNGKPVRAPAKKANGKSAKATDKAKK